MDNDPFKGLKGSAAIEAQLERERQALKATGGELRARVAPAALAQTALDGAMALGDRAIRTPFADWATLAADASESRVVKAALSGIGRMRGRAAPAAKAPMTAAAFVAENTGKAGEAKRDAKIRAAAEKRATDLAQAWTARLDARVTALRAEMKRLDKAHLEGLDRADPGAGQRHEIARAALLSRFAADARADLDGDLADLPADIRSAEVDRREAHYRHQLSQLVRDKGPVGRMIDDHPLAVTAAAAVLGVALAALLMPAGDPSEKG